MTESWTIRLPYSTPPLTLNGRQHWATKARGVKEVRGTTATLARVLQIPACESIHVQLHYVPRDGRRRDADNLVGTLKPCIDGLVDAGVVPDDSPEYVTWSPPVIDAPDFNYPHLYLVIERTT
ncbi:MAG: phage Tortellini [Actinomycetota bacterium]